MRIRPSIKENREILFLREYTHTADNTSEDKSRKNPPTINKDDVVRDSSKTLARRRRQSRAVACCPKYIRIIQYSRLQVRVGGEARACCPSLGYL